MKIAIIIRNLRQFGGGEQNVVTLTEALNEIKIVPDIFSEEKASIYEIKSYFGKEIKYRHRQFKRPGSDFKRVFKEIFSPHPLKKNLLKYDFIYDFTNKPPVYRKNDRYLKYLYICKDSRALENSFARKLQFDLYDFFSILGFSKFNKFSTHVLNVTQSKFTQEEIRKKTKKILPIIYPPVNLKYFTHRKNKIEMAVSLGRFSMEKNQVFVLKLAEKFPKIPFFLIGTINDPEYFSKLKSCVRVKKLKNVHFLPNVKQNIVRDCLAKAAYYIQSTKDEHFGISTVEAIAAGCLPICHRSGGQIEIVKNKGLLYVNLMDAEKKFKKILNMDQSEKTFLVNKLQKNIKKFDEKKFKSALLAYLPK